MKHRTLTYWAVCTLAFGAIAFSPTANAQATGHQTLFSAATKKHHTVHRRGRPAGQFACTPAGCHRIPPNCHPEPDFDFFGNPTGFDRIVCSRG
jgi:hypothetical protein